MMSRPGRPGGPGRAAATLAAGCAALSLGLAACTAGHGSGPQAGAASPDALSDLGLHGEPAIGPLPVVTGPNSLSLPLDPYGLSASQQLTISEAERAAEQACIRKYLPGVSLGAFGRLVLLPAPTEPLAYLASSQAAGYGYHDPTVMALAAQGRQ